MACRSLSIGRSIPCIGGKSGFKAISISEYSRDNIITGTNGLVTSLPVGITQSYRYEVKSNGSKFEPTYNGDEETRNGVIDGVLTVILQKLDMATTNELMQVAKKEVNIFVETYNGDILVIGAENGNILKTNLMSTGGAGNDLNGYTLTFTSQSIFPYMVLNGTASTTYNSIVIDGQ